VDIIILIIRPHTTVFANLCAMLLFTCLGVYFARRHVSDSLVHLQATVMQTILCIRSDIKYV
jgi:hypothetical protein